MSVKSTRVWLLASAGLVVLAVVGVVTWLVIPGKSPDSGASGAASPTRSGPAVTGDEVKQVLLNGAQLTKMLDQPFKKTIRPPVYGGFAAMGEGSARGDCAGVVDVAPKKVYQSAKVQSYARQTWGDAQPGDPGFKPLSSTLMFVDEAVVALPSAADAQALFTTFAEQWKRCNGQAVNQEPDPADPNDAPPLPGSEMHITDIHVTDTVLAASVVLDKKPDAPDTRALGVQGNCLVEVLLPFTGAQNVPGSAQPQTSSSDVARALMDRVSKLG